MRLTEKWTSFFGRTTYSKRKGVTEQDVIDKLGKIEDGCLCECPQNMIKVDFPPKAIIYTIDKVYMPSFYEPCTYKIHKSEATLSDCLNCVKDNAFGTKYFTNKEECWKKYRELIEKEWNL